VFAIVKPQILGATLICVALGSMSNGALAVSVEVAKKCDALTAKAYPPREPGNPAAGSDKGTGLEAQSYYQKCITNGGKAGDNADTQGK
jgi:hypothetical protein